jgi:hypothetical protein
MFRDVPQLYSIRIYSFKALSWTVESFLLVPPLVALGRRPFRRARSHWYGVLNGYVALVAESLGLESITTEAVVILASISVLLSGILSWEGGSGVEVAENYRIADFIVGYC